jgi:hypothetical protein
VLISQEFRTAHFERDSESFNIVDGNISLAALD